MANLFQNQTVNGDSTIVDIQDGGYRVLKITGVFNGALITPKVDFNDDDFTDLLEDNVIQTIDKPGVVNIQPFKSNMRFKLNLSNAGGSTDITAEII